MAMTKQFTKTQWNNNRDPAITAEQLNRMEKGIDDNDTRIVELDKAVTANKTAGDKSLAEVNKTLQKHTEDITAVNTELTSQGKAIGELADKKITKFYASSQGENTLNDSDDGKMQDMMLYGKSEQKQYSGKNLLNATLQTTTKNGVTCTANGDGTYTLNGTATADVDLTITKSLSVVNGKKYRLIGSLPNNATGSLYLLNGTDSATEYGAGVTFTYVGDSTNTKMLHLFLPAKKTFNNVITKPMIVDADTYPSVTYDDFEPYVGGIPSPNPDYPQEIKSVVEPVVKVTGKNLLKLTLQTTSQSGVMCMANGDGTYTLNGTATATVAFILVTNIAKYFETNNSLKLIGLTKTGSSTTFDFRCYIDGTGVFIDYGSGTIVPKPKNNNNNIAVIVRKDAKLDNLVLKPMLVTDLNATIDDFEPYREQSVSLTGITLNAIPVSSGGNVTIDGQQYISDYVDVERGKVVRMVGKTILTGLDSWSLAERTETFVGVFYTRPNGCKANATALSNRYLYKGSGVKYIYEFDTLYGQLRFLAQSSNQTLAEWKEYVSNNNITVLYQLATPTEESLSEELAEKLKALQTYYPQTNLFITSNQLDGYAIFNYPISLANGWNYVKQQIGDTRDYIYDMDLQMAQAYVNSEYAVALTELEV